MRGAADGGNGGVVQGVEGHRAFDQVPVLVTALRLNPRQAGDAEDGGATEAGRRMIPKSFLEVAQARLVLGNVYLRLRPVPENVGEQDEVLAESRTNAKENNLRG